MRFENIKEAVKELFLEIKNKYIDYDLTIASQCKDLANDLSTDFSRNFERIKDNIQEKAAKRYIYSKIYNDKPNTTLNPRGISKQFTRFKKEYPDKIHGNFRNSVEQYTIFMGYMGWDGFVADPSMSIDDAIIQFPINQEPETIKNSSYPEAITALLKNKTNQFQKYVYEIIGVNLQEEYFKEIKSNPTLLVSFNNSINFKTTLQKMSSLKKDIKYVAGIYETLNFFLEEWRKDKVKPEYYDIYDTMNFSKNYQYFEPPHSKASYCELNDIDLYYQDEKNDFFKLMNESASLNYFQKINVLLNSNRLGAEKTKSLIVAFNEEKLKFIELGEIGIFGTIEHYFDNILEEFQFLIDKQISYKTILVDVLENINKIYIAIAIFENFQYHRYINILPDRVKYILDNLNYSNPTLNEKEKRGINSL